MADSSDNPKMLNGTSGILLNSSGIATSKVNVGVSENFVKVGDKLIKVKSGNRIEQLKELAELGILIPPKPPTKKTIETHPPNRLGPNFRKTRHKILKKALSRKKK